MPSNWLLFDRIRALTRQYNIYQAERTFSDQSSLDKIFSSGDFNNNSLQSDIYDQTNLQLGRLERYKDFEHMDQTGEISLALDLYADEASLVDPERKHTIVIKARNKRLKRELEDLFFGTLLWDNYNRPAMRYLCKFGDCPFEIVPTKHRNGVSALKFMSVYNFTRVETRHGDLVGFFYQDETLENPQFMHPWQVMHLRLTDFENTYSPYGKAIIDGGRRAFRQLRLMEDAALIYRITRAPEKLKFKIPVGAIPHKEIPEYMQMIARQLKKQRFYNPTTGQFDERYSPIIQEDNYYLPSRQDGVGPEIEVLEGGKNLNEIEDIEYFKKKMISPTKIPFARVGIGEGSGEASEKSLSQAHNEFAKSVQWVQRAGSTGLKKVAIVHLALRGYSVEDLKGFDIAYASTSAMEELYRIETWQTRTSVMMDLKDLGWFPKEWIVTHFTDLSPDEIEELKDMENTESQGGPGGGAPGGLDLVPGDESPEGGEGDEDIPDEPEGSPLEGFDYAAEKRLIAEYRKVGNKKAIMEIVNKWSERIGKDSASRTEFSSGFEHILESKELDGLTREQYSNNEVYDPNGGEGLLVEWSVPLGDRNSAIKDIYELITEDLSDYGNQVIEEQVGIDDLPS